MSLVNLELVKFRRHTSQPTHLTQYLGKSLGRFYLLRRLIGERLPVLWVRSGHIYLFATDGVWGIRAESFSSKSLYTVFAIADAFDHRYVEKLLGDIHTLLVYHSSPREKIWTRWSALRDTPPLVITMNPWQRVELLRARVQFFCCSPRY